MSKRGGPRSVGTCRNVYACLFTARRAQELAEEMGTRAKALEEMQLALTAKAKELDDARQTSTLSNVELADAKKASVAQRQELDGVRAALASAVADGETKSREIEVRVSRYVYTRVDTRSFMRVHRQE